MSLKRIVIVAAALLLTLPATTLADGFDFGFTGGTVDVSGSTLTNASGLGVPSTLTDITRFIGTPPGSFTQGSPSFTGANLGTVTFATGNFTGNCGASSTCYGAAGSFFTIVANTAFAPGISAGDVLFSGSFVDVNTALFAGGPLPTGPFPAGTGAIFTYLGATFTCGNPPQTGTCFRVYGAISGTTNPALIAALGLGSLTSVTGWVAQIDFIFSDPTGNSLDVSMGDAQLLVVPEPGTLALFGTGLIGLAGLLRRKLAA